MPRLHIVWLLSGILIFMMSWAIPFEREAEPDQVAETEPMNQNRTQPASLVLITMDTTRADFIGAYGHAMKVTPNIDRLADSGVLYLRAMSPSPLTLPAHATLLTGLDPPQHGLRDNGRARLAADIPTLATVLEGRGFATAAFVSSRVLDRRFALDRGFLVYDDKMAAERVGEYGYAERDAEAVTNRALAWLSSVKRDQPFFLWVHYYDPHSPYEAPGRSRGGTLRDAYRAEIAFMDRHIARLLTALFENDQQELIAVVGDHGESLGEHGERTHGIFLYRSVLEVPLIIAGIGLPEGCRVAEVVSTRQLAPSLLHLMGFGSDLGQREDCLPGLSDGPSQISENWVYSETYMPENAYGWSPIKALTGHSWRLIVAPRPELYDIKNDPAELNNMIEEKPEETQRLQSALLQYEKRIRIREAEVVDFDPDLVAALESLGYVDGAQKGKNDGIDPKDGLRLLNDLERAKMLIQRGAFTEALKILTDLKELNPNNLPVLTHLARVQLLAGEAEAAVATYRSAMVLNPESEFLAFSFAGALDRSGLSEAAARAYRHVLAIDPRSASAWLSLAELAEDKSEKSAILKEAIAADTESTIVFTQLAELEYGAGNLAHAETLLGEACRLTPELTGVWLLRAQVAEDRGRPLEARAWYQRALSLDRANPEVMLRLARIHLQLNEFDAGRSLLLRVVQIAPDSDSGRAAQTLLDGVRKE